MKLLDVVRLYLELVDGGEDLEGGGVLKPQHIQLLQTLRGQTTDGRLREVPVNITVSNSTSYTS